MTEKVINISVPEGYEVDLQKSSLLSGKIVFKSVNKELPKTWEELEVIRGYWVDENCRIDVTNSSTKYTENRNVWPTVEEARASIALSQLCQLRDRYNAGWKPDWNSVAYSKYGILIQNDIINSAICYTTQHLLVFSTAELRDEFLLNFRELIGIAKPLL